MYITDAMFCVLAVVLSCTLRDSSGLRTSEQVSEL